MAAFLWLVLLPGPETYTLRLLSAWTHVSPREGWTRLTGRCKMYLVQRKQTLQYFSANMYTFLFFWKHTFRIT